MLRTHRTSRTPFVVHDHRLLELFEKLVSVGERRIGLRLTRITELLHSLEERERTRDEILRGIWIALAGLFIAAIGAIVVLGLKVWALQ